MPDSDQYGKRQIFCDSANSMGAPFSDSSNSNSNGNSNSNSTTPIAGSASTITGTSMVNNNNSNNNNPYNHNSSIYNNSISNYNNNKPHANPKEYQSGLISSASMRMSRQSRKASSFSHDSHGNLNVSVNIQHNSFIGNGNGNGNGNGPREADLSGFSEKSSMYNHSGVTAISTTSSIERELADNRGRRQEAESSLADLILKRDTQYLENPDLQIFNNGKLLRESKLNSIHQAEITSTFIFNRIYNEKKKVRLSRAKQRLVDGSNNNSNSDYYYNGASDNNNNNSNNRNKFIQEPEEEEEEEDKVLMLSEKMDLNEGKSTKNAFSLGQGVTSRYSSLDRLKLASTNHQASIPQEKPSSLNDIIMSIPGYTKEYLSTELSRYEEQLTSHHADSDDAEDEELANRNGKSNINGNGNGNTSKKLAVDRKSRFKDMFYSRKFHSGAPNNGYQHGTTTTNNNNNNNNNYNNNSNSKTKSNTIQYSRSPSQHYSQAHQQQHQQQHPQFQVPSHVHHKHRYDRNNNYHHQKYYTSHHHQNHIHNSGADPVYASEADAIAAAQAQAQVRVGGYNGNDFYENNFVATRNANLNKLQNKFSRSYDFVSELKPIEIELYLKLDEEFENELQSLRQQKSKGNQYRQFIQRAYTSGDLQNEDVAVKLLVVNSLSKKVQKLDDDNWMYS